MIYLDEVLFRVPSEGTGLRGKGSSFGSRASFTVYAIDFVGERGILGIYIMESEAAMAWGRILGNLQRRGFREMFCFCVHGLKGSGGKSARCTRAASSSVASCTRYGARRGSAPRSTARRSAETCGASTPPPPSQQARTALEAFGERWDAKYPKVAASWLGDWDEVMAYVAFPKTLRQIMSTTDPVEAVHQIVRKPIVGKEA